MAEKLKISKAYWSALERGDRTPSAFILNSLNAYLDISTNWLMSGHGTPTEGDVVLNHGMLNQELKMQVAELNHAYNKVDNLLNLFEKDFKNDLAEINKYAEGLIQPIAFAENCVTNLDAGIPLVDHKGLISWLTELTNSFNKDFDDLFSIYYMNHMHPRRRKKFEAPKNVYQIKLYQK
ncbi:hypothetical protein MASR2M41_09930 [Flammeovirgaceae bacterium]